MSHKESFLTAQCLRDRLAYDPGTGVFLWRNLPGNDLKHRQWNAKNSGQVAGSVSKRGYVNIGINGVVYQAHRLAWLYVYGEWPRGSVDHIDRNPSNNRIQNLRGANCRENSRNRRTPRHSKSGVKGVHWNKKLKRWRAGIRVDGKMIHLGHFNEIEDAEAAYTRATYEYFGEFSTGPKA